MKILFAILLLGTAVCSQAQITQKVIPVKTTMAAAAPAVASAKVAFQASATYVGGTEVMPNNMNSKVIFTGSLFDEAKNFSIPNGCFVVPADGIYHFDVRVSWLRFTAPGMITMNLNTDEFSMLTTSVQTASTTSAVFDTQYSMLVKLRAGQKLYVYLKQNSTAIQKYQQVQLAGFKVE